MGVVCGWRRRWWLVAAVACVRASNQSSTNDKDAGCWLVGWLVVDCHQLIAGGRFRPAASFEAATLCVLVCAHVCVRACVCACVVVVVVVVTTTKKLEKFNTPRKHTHTNKQTKQPSRGSGLIFLIYLFLGAGDHSTRRKPSSTFVVIVHGRHSFFSFPIFAFLFFLFAQTFRTDRALLFSMTSPTRSISFTMDCNILVSPL